MANDVEALFKKINQSGLPYKVFEPDETINDILDAVEAVQSATKAYTKPKLVEAPPPADEPTPGDAAAPVPEEPAPQPARHGFLRNYAPARPERAPEEAPAEPQGPVLLKDLFTRMADRG